MSCMSSLARLSLTICLLCLGTRVTNARSHCYDLDTNVRTAGNDLALGDKAGTSKRPTPEAYQTQRDLFFRYEESRALGAELELNERELLANQILMTAKAEEYKVGLVTPHLFKPSQHFFSVLQAISDSPLFGILSMMPKGGVLHAHDTALSSTAFLIETSYRANLWVCERTGGEFQAFGLRFARTKPDIVLDESCTWTLLSVVRKQRSAAVVDEYLREHLTMYPVEKFADVNEAWQQFMSIFGLLDGMLTYAPVWADYYYNALTEFHEDGVQYLEFRTTLPILYDLEGTVYTELDTARIYKETLDKYMAEHTTFIGSKLIYAPVRSVTTETIEKYIGICIELKTKYPDFVAGFDLVGQEELGGPLKAFIPQLLSMPENIDFFFHAGETNWNGAAVDENVIDAILLGTKRIGHGFALIKHPLALQAMKERNIAVEINPISNQVLQLVSDYRNHPCSHYFADNYTVVISSDDPSFWRANPLSHDFYIAFLGIASSHADLRLLKKLATNSLQYSALSDLEKAEAFRKWQAKWNDFIEHVIKGDTSAAVRRLKTNRID